MPPDFFIVDVFAEHAYAGNPLAVVLGAENLDDATMQLLAAEANYSETTFVYSPEGSERGYRTRLFTPAREIAFAGHPLLGTAWVIRHAFPEAQAGPVVLKLSVGDIPVSFESGTNGEQLVWFAAPDVERGPTCAHGRIACALGVSEVDLDTRFPVRQMSAGTSAVIVPVKSLDALRRANLNLDAYAELLAEGFPPLVYLFCTETRSPANDLSARFFFEAHGVREDPATGNGAAFLAHYLMENPVFPAHKRSWRIEQGHEVRRPSLVRLRLTDTDAFPRVEVGGQVLASVVGSLAQRAFGTSFIASAAR